MANLDARRVLNVAFTLLVDGDLGQERFDFWGERLDADPGRVDVLTGALIVPGVEETAEAERAAKWNPATWGTTPEAQEQLVRTLTALGV